MKLHLVDGTYELFRMFYGARKATARDGQEVGATRGMLRTLLALLAEPDVTHVGVAFDHVIESFRNDLFAGYKTGAGIDPRLWSQAPLAEQAAAALGIVVWPLVEFEADDGMATAAHRWADEVEQVVLCSPDKDLAQCVTGQRVVLRDRRRKITLDAAGVVEKWGVSPASIPDWLALVGDSADGIPGIPRWGARSASSVLARYGHLDAIPDDAGAWDVTVRGAATLAANLAGQRDDARLYRRLAVLRTDVPLPETLDQLAWRGADRPAMQALCERIEAPRLMGLVPRWRE